MLQKKKEPECRLCQKCILMEFLPAKNIMNSKFHFTTELARYEMSEVVAQTWYLPPFLPIHLWTFIHFHPFSSIFIHVFLFHPRSSIYQSNISHGQKSGNNFHFVCHILSGTVKTLPEAQRTQGIDFITWVMSPAKKNENSVEKKIQVKEWLYLH